MPFQETCVVLLLSMVFLLIEAQNTNNDASNEQAKINEAMIEAQNTNNDASNEQGKLNVFIPFLAMFF